MVLLFTTSTQHTHGGKNELHNCYVRSFESLYLYVSELSRCVSVYFFIEIALNRHQNDLSNEVDVLHIFMRKCWSEAKKKKAAKELNRTYISQIHKAGEQT